MNYTGRITLLLILFFSLLLWTIYEFMNNNAGITHAVEAVLYIPLCWWLGFKYDKTKFYSERDTLTEIYNRRFVIHIFSKLCAMTDKKSRSMALFVLDIDDFKAINDKYGHERGDLVLQQISNMLMQFTSRNDVVARWGGDEFLIIVPFMEKPGMEALITQLQSGLAELSEKIHTDIEVSIGTAIYPYDAKKLEILTQIADRNMYEIKLRKEISFPAVGSV